MNLTIRCANPHCRRLFHPNARVKNQRYCDKRDCQRARKARWQRHKMRDDPDYRDDHRDGQQAWIERNRDYWRRYRSLHPEYVKRNQLLQKERDRRRQDLAKMDTLGEISPVKPGSYYLIPAKEDLAKMDTLSQRYFLIPSAYPFLAKKDSMDVLSAFPLGWKTKGGSP
jgi:hypothetical protein